MSQVYIFHREKSFYLIDLADDADAIKNAENNPGTLKVTDGLDGRTVWELPEKEPDVFDRLNLALARINELETAFRKTRDRLSFHDGCSRFNVKDLTILRDADAAIGNLINSRSLTLSKVEDADLKDHQHYLVLCDGKYYTAHYNSEFRTLTCQHYRIPSREATTIYELPK